MQKEMGYRWGQLEHSAAGAFQNGLLNMHGWSCIEGWLRNDLVTTDIPFLSQAPIIRLISATTEQLAAFAAYTVFIASCCLAPRSVLWPSSRMSHYGASPSVVNWCGPGSAQRCHSGLNCGAAKAREEINQLTATLAQTWSELKLCCHMVHQPEKKQQMNTETNKHQLLRVISFPFCKQNTKVNNNFTNVSW